MVTYNSLLLNYTHEAHMTLQGPTRYTQLTQFFKNKFCFLVIFKSPLNGLLVLVLLAYYTKFD